MEFDDIPANKWKFLRTKHVSTGLYASFFLGHCETILTHLYPTAGVPVEYQKDDSFATKVFLLHCCNVQLVDCKNMKTESCANFLSIYGWALSQL